MEYKVKQIKPNHPNNILGYKLDKHIQPLLQNEIVVGQLKYDGERMLVHFNHGEAYTTSRSIAKNGYFKENHEKLPQLQEYSKQLGINLIYTVIDCECYSNTWNEVMSVLRSLPETAAELQKTIKVKFACFDLLWYNGEDIREKPYWYRLKLLKKVLYYLSLYTKDFHMVDFVGEDFKPCNLSKAKIFNTFEEIEESKNKFIELGHEGCVYKSLSRTYYDDLGALKYKKRESVDCVVIGWDYGNGKYSSTVGRLKIGYIENGKEVHISNVNCGTDADRDYWRDNWNSLKYSVLEVLCMAVSETSLTQPVYSRIRTDKDYTMVTKQTIFQGGTKL